MKLDFVKEKIFQKQNQIQTLGQFKEEKK